MSDTATPALHRESDTLYRQIAEIWREKIVTGEYKPGDALPSERDISESLGVRRIPVREAMKSLEYLGIVKQVRGKGVFVQKTDPGEVLAKIGPFLAPPDAATLSELFDLRILFEGYAAELAAKNRTDADLKTLQASLDLLNASITDEKSAEEASHRFHQEIAAMAGNRLLIILWHFFAELLEASRRLTLWSPERREESLTFHQTIFDAIRDQRSDDARNLMQRHLANAKQRLTEREKTLGAAE